MTLEEKDILWKSYRAFLKYKRLSNLLTIILVIAAIICAMAGRPDASIIAGGIALMSVFHAGICRENAKQLRTTIFQPESEA